MNKFKIALLSMMSFLLMFLLVSWKLTKVDEKGLKAKLVVIVNTAKDGVSYKELITIMRGEKQRWDINEDDN